MYFSSFSAKLSSVITRDHGFKKMDEEQSLRGGSVDETIDDEEDADAPSQNEGQSKEENSELTDVSRETSKELFVLKSALFDGGDGSDEGGANSFKSLVESFVNDHNLPKEKAEALVAMVQNGADQLDEFKSTLLMDYEDHLASSDKDSLASFCLDHFESPEQLENISSFAQDKWCKNRGLDENETASLMGNKAFLKSMKNERDNFTQRTPAIYGQNPQRAALQEQAEMERILTAIHSRSC